MFTHQNDQIKQKTWFYFRQFANVNRLKNQFKFSQSLA